MKVAAKIELNEGSNLITIKVEALEEKSKTMNDIRESVLKNANLFSYQILIKESRQSSQKYF